jgi:hypothetical protein
MMRLVFFTSLFLAVSYPLFSQTFWVVTGTVRGDQGEPLVGASVIVDGEFNTVTDTLGQYVVRKADIPKLLTIRYLGYFPQKGVLNTQDYQNTQANIDFALVNQAPSLGEVTITAKPIEAIVTEDFTIDLYDFGFVGQNILLLLREKKRYVLRLIREDGEVLSQLRLPESCHVLHRSCLGDFHVLGEHSAWEISFKDTELDTLSRYTADDFHRFIEPCEQQSGGQFYFAQHGLLNQSLKYIVFEQNKQPRVAFDIRDAKGLDNAMGALGDFFDNKPMIFRTPAWRKQAGETAEFEIHETLRESGNLSTVEELIKLAGYGDDQIYRISELEAIRRDSVYAPILKINDTLCLFDHTNNRIVRFGPLLERTDVVFMSYHLVKGWEKLLLQDDQNNRIYARFSDHKGLILKEINASTGREKKTYALALAPYVSEKFKIRNGMLYFIGQPDVNTPNKILYKLNIFAE